MLFKPPLGGWGQKGVRRENKADDGCSETILLVPDC